MKETFNNGIAEDERQVYRNNLEDYAMAKLEESIYRGTPFSVFEGVIMAMQPHTDKKTEYITIRCELPKNSSVNKDLINILNDRILLVVSHSHLLRENSSSEPR